MKTERPAGEPAEVVETILRSHDFRLVELAIQKVKGRTHVHCVVYKPGGFDLDQLGDLHRQIVPSLEMVLDQDDLYVEFSSPGINRELKSTYEFSVFVGETIRILVAEENRWLEGRIESSDDTSVTVRSTPEAHESIGFGRIQKARLVS